MGQLGLCGGCDYRLVDPLTECISAWVNSANARPNSAPGWAQMKLEFKRWQSYLRLGHARVLARGGYSYIGLKPPRSLTAVAVIGGGLILGVKINQIQWLARGGYSYIGLKPPRSLTAVAVIGGGLILGAKINQIQWQVVREKLARMATQTLYLCVWNSCRSMVIAGTVGASS